jgi:phosphoribosylformylglycinamidine synthase
VKAAVLVFPGSNCDRDLAVAFRAAGFTVDMVWHKDADLPAGTDIVGVPGGFSYGDYLRCGAIAAQSPIMRAVARHAEAGGHVLGICNGFQVLCETRLLPGALMRNAGLKFVCRMQALRVETTDSAFTAGYAAGQEITVPIAHHDGNYVADPETLAMLRAEDRVAFRYVGNPNGEMDDIAGILSANRRVLGLMPHPERVVDAAQGGTDGAPMLRALAEALVAA